MGSYVHHMHTIWFYVWAIWEEQMSNTWVNSIVLMADDLPDMHSISSTAVTLLFSKIAIKLLRSFVTVVA